MPRTFHVPDELFAPDPPPPPPPPPVDPAVARQEAIIDATRVDALHNDFLAHEQQVLHTGPDAYFGLRSAAAMDAAAPTLDRLQRDGEAMLDRTETPSQRALLAGALKVGFAATQDEIARHMARETKAWQRQTAQDRIDFLAGQAGLDHADDRLLAAYGNAAEGAAAARTAVDGTPPDAPETQAARTAARSAVLRGAVEGALAEGDHGAALALHERVVRALTPDDLAALQPSIEGAQVRTRADAYLADLGPPSGTIAELEAAHAVATERNQADWADQPSQRATNQHVIDVSFGLSRRRQGEADAKTAAELTDWLARPGSDGGPQTDRPPMPLWVRLTSQEQQDTDAVLARHARTGNVGQISNIELAADESSREEQELAADNQRQNKMVRDIVVQLGLTPDQAQALHREISGQGMTYQEILERAKEMFGK